MLLSVQKLETHNKDEHLLLPPRKHKPRLYSSLQHPNLSFHIAWVSLLFVFTEKIPTVYVPCILYTERYKRDKGQRCSGMICSEAYHLLVSSLVLYRGPQIKENHPWTSLSFISPVLNHTVNRREPAWWRTSCLQQSTSTLAPVDAPITNYKDRPIPTLIISKSFLIYSRRSLTFAQ